MEYFSKGIYFGYDIDKVLPSIHQISNLFDIDAKNIPNCLFHFSQRLLINVPLVAKSRDRLTEKMYLSMVALLVRQNLFNYHGNIIQNQIAPSKNTYAVLRTRMYYKLHKSSFEGTFFFQM